MEILVGCVENLMGVVWQVVKEIEVVLVKMCLVVNNWKK